MFPRLDGYIWLDFEGLIKYIIPLPKHSAMCPLILKPGNDGFITEGIKDIRRRMHVNSVKKRPKVNIIPFDFEQLMQNIYHFAPGVQKQIGYNRNSFHSGVITTQDPG